ncbi:hypothetical protein, partial [Pseudomonas frederiksbergensis]|uniref:hypothetical protein n=1 Tax=Pseudomonas frederiksbergensis TaxID=104087 RepID=UPI003D1AEAAA
RCRKLRNSLFTKEFSVSTAPEVGRIIDFQNLPSTPDFTILSYKAKSPKNTKADLNSSAFCPSTYKLGNANCEAS